MPITKQTESEIVVRRSLWMLAAELFFLVIGGFLLFAVFLPGMGVGERVFALGMGTALTYLGIQAMYSNTRIAFDQPHGYLTVTRGHVPVFLRSRRRVSISRGQLERTFVHSVTTSGLYGGTHTKYQVTIVTTEGQAITLHEGSERDVAQYLAKRIREFTGHPAK